MSQHCLVTGAPRGIGLEFVRQLLARGDRVVATCRHPGKATALNTLAGEYPGRLRVLPLDIASEKSRAELVRELPLVCGHWSTLGLFMGLGIYSIDTGAVWGGKLTALELGPELRLHQVGGRQLPAGEKAGD